MKHINQNGSNYKYNKKNMSFKISNHSTSAKSNLQETTLLRATVGLHPFTTNSRWQTKRKYNRINLNSSSTKHKLKRIPNSQHTHHEMVQKLLQTFAMAAARFKAVKVLISLTLTHRFTVQCLQLPNEIQSRLYTLTRTGPKKDQLVYHAAFTRLAIETVCYMPPYNLRNTSVTPHRVQQPT